MDSRTTNQKASFFLLFLFLFFFLSFFRDVERASTRGVARELVEVFVSKGVDPFLLWGHTVGDHLGKVGISPQASHRELEPLARYSGTRARAASQGSYVPSTAQLVAGRVAWLRRGRPGFLMA